MELNNLPDTRIMVPMTTDEKQALQKWASQECRGVKQQIRHIIRIQLTERGLLSTPTDPATPSPTAG